jgi:hypothetical protein
VIRDRPARFQLAAFDADGHPLQTAILKGPRFGRVYGTGLDFTYVPNFGFVGRDSFTYRVWDGFSLSGEGSVQLRVEAAGGVSLKITSVIVAQAGVEIALQGEEGAVARVECSEDLETWTVLGTATLVNSAARFLDPWDGEERGARFYRAVQGAVMGE